MHQLLDEALTSHADAWAVRDQAGRWTYQELADRSHGYARWLHSLGVRPGERVLTKLESDRDLVALCYAVSRLGAVFVPVNPAMKLFHLRAVLENAEPVVVITTEKDLAWLPENVGAPAYDIELIRPLAEELGGGEPLASPAVSAQTPAALVYTSGSTATPKAVICPHAQMVFASEAIQQVLGYREDDVVFCRFPISWDYGLYKILLSCLGRSELVLAGVESDLLLLNRMWETGATVVPIVPSLASMIVKLAERQPDRLPEVRMFTNTGAALPRGTVEALTAAFPKAQVVRQFGQTECKRISIVPPGAEHVPPGSVGRPLPGTRVVVLAPDGTELPTGEVGEIVVAGPHVMPGYWRMDEQTERAFRPGPDGRRRLHTGDFGRLDAEGNLYFEGRRDDMFKRKGIRMSTVEIEAAAADVSGVRAAAAVPPGEGYDLTLFVESELPPGVILREIAGRLEPAKVPAMCRVLNEMPLTQHGKVDRTGLAAWLRDEG
ncbi:AMP-binding protein [Streptomyces sp. DSM 44915]|uniref:AMP-binding protein n=1 Tax=Streptomyces chisholmiae TaxID=3075540 RepID=A0ABU2JSU3_9ACTN|nr:AMP-binding protein [Streptomyces sp. DSM 44915]MDT0268061.1 AMP-binding protein [Streptomyces sp. DSM 44915]